MKKLKGILFEIRRSDNAAKNGRMETQLIDGHLFLTDAKELVQEFYGEADFENGQVGLENFAKKIKDHTSEEYQEMVDQHATATFLYVNSEAEK